MWVQTLKNSSKVYISRWQWHNLRFWQRWIFRFWDFVCMCYGWHYQNRKHFIQNVTPNEPKKKFKNYDFFENLSPLSLEIYLLIKNLYFLNGQALTWSDKILNLIGNRKIWVKIVNFPSEMENFQLDIVLF